MGWDMGARHPPFQRPERSSNVCGQRGMAGAVPERGFYGPNN